MKFSWLGPREGVIVEWPLNGLFYDRRGVIITSQMVVIRFPSNDGHYLKCRNFFILIKEIPANYLVFEITMTKALVVSKIYLTGWSRLGRDQ